MIYPLGLLIPYGFTLKSFPSIFYSVISPLLIMTFFLRYYQKIKDTSDNKTITIIPKYHLAKIIFILSLVFNTLLLIFKIVMVCIYFFQKDSSDFFSTWPEYLLMDSELFFAVKNYSNTATVNPYVLMFLPTCLFLILDLL